MRFITSALLLCSTLLPGALAQNEDSQVAAHYEQTGQCAYYFEKPAKKNPLSQACIKYCETHGGHGYSECDHALYKDIDIMNGLDKSLIAKDDDGDLWVPTKCKCENKDVEGITNAILDIVIEALEQLDNIICAVMVSAFKSILEVGIMFVPGGQATGVLRAVQGAKSFVENGLEAADFFGNWVGNACGVPDWNFDLWGALIGAPDSMGTSVGCKKKNKADCKQMDSIPDPPKSNKPDGPNKTDDPAPTKTDDPAPTKTDDPAPTKTDDPAPTTTDDPATTNSPTSTTATDSTSTSSSSTESCSASGTQSGAACEATTPCQIQTADVGGEDDLTDIFDEVLRRNGRRSPHFAHIVKRAPKSGKPCSANTAYKDWELASDDYPSNGQLDADVKAWGFETQNSYCDYDWQDGKKRNPSPPSNYDSEHVMEWQIVTDFFAKMQASGGTKYEHPDPAQNKAPTDFCTYWIESWKDQEFSVNGSPAMTAWKHIAAAYPSNNNHKEEMIALQRNINAPAKANLFTDSIPMIWTEKKMDKYVDSNRNKVLERLRLSLGAQKYLTDQKVKDIFKAQKERMGAIIGELDTAMATHPRETTDPVTGVKTTYTAWVKQDLLTEWNTFIDLKWANAVAKHTKVMNKWWNALDDKHCASQSKKTPADREFCERLRKLETQRNTATALTKPW